jgi:hypothetical protein
MPDDVLVVSKCFMRNPIRILVKKEELTLEGNTILLTKIADTICFLNGG